MKKNNILFKITQGLLILFSFVSIICTTTNAVNSFPIYAQQGYENPREATGRIVCANCHLAQKTVSIEVPKSILPNSVFEARVSIPYNETEKQIIGNGTEGNLNTGAVLILPEGFKLAPKTLLSNEIKNKTKNFYIQPYSTSKENILVIGPIAGKNNQEIIFPILSPDPSKDKNIFFSKYPIYVGGNRGRGQIYPTGDKSNNNTVTSAVNGTIKKIEEKATGESIVNIEQNDGEITTTNIPKGLKLVVTEGNIVSMNQNLTNDPNVGGFGQNETEIVLQSATRIKRMIIFFIGVTIAQIFFVLKKKQWEKVQAANMNF
uniref:Cytochrome f n=1 Tax=Pleurostichidium falkenbergii TaxID=121064 RepID=A0A4D6UYE9_9FLOR|nr:apocytochrome f [Pleurostichidium falkenbergii]QCH39668.1 apocytochrome f [Pleurostichidium falkenbergii]